MHSEPLVSVVICAFNAGEHLRGALESILGQTYANLEVLVVDDGSTDGSVEALQPLIHDPRVRWIAQKNAGKSAALNRALDELRGEFYAIQDADDTSYPDRIRRQVEAMRSHPQAAAVFCGHDLIIDGHRLAPRFRAKDPQRCRSDIEGFRMPAHDPTAMYRLAKVRQLRYDQALRVGQGYDYILRVGELHPMVVLGECLYSYRVHTGSATRSDPEVRQRFVREVVRRARQRRGEPVADSAPSTGSRPVSRIRDNNLAAHFMESACDLARAGRRWSAVQVGLACARLHPLQFHYQKALVYAMSPQWLVRRLRPSES